MYATCGVYNRGTTLHIKGFDTLPVAEYSHQLSATHRWDGGHFCFFGAKRDEVEQTG